MKKTMIKKSKDLKMEDSDCSEHLDFDQYDMADITDDFGETRDNKGRTKEDADSSGAEEVNDSKEGERNKVMANVIQKILSTGRKDNVILSKAKKNSQKKTVKAAETDNFEIVDELGNIKEEAQVKVEETEQSVPQSLHERNKAKKIWDQRFRVIPSVTDDREKEKKLRLIATQGVVQLFSAIEKHKNRLQKKVSETRSVMGREKVLETTGKEAFMAVLREQGRKAHKKERLKEEVKEVKDEMKEEKMEVKEEEEEEERQVIPVAKKPRWSVLSDNFYKEPTLQAWDQHSDSNEDD